MRYSLTQYPYITAEVMTISEGMGLKHGKSINGRGRFESEWPVDTFLCAANQHFASMYIDSATMMLIKYRGLIRRNRGGGHF